MVLDIGQIDLLVGHIVRHPQILHILAAQHSQVIQVLGHVGDRFADLAQAQRHLEVVIATLVSTRQLALAQKQTLVRIERYLFRRILRD